MGKKLSCFSERAVGKTFSLPVECGRETALNRSATICGHDWGWFYHEMVPTEGGVEREEENNFL